MFVKVETDQGIHGVGEAYSCGPDDATAATIADFKRWLVGQDPRNIERLWAMMMNFTRFPGGSVVNAAISGIEHALWDISGKVLGVPVYRSLTEAHAASPVHIVDVFRRSDAVPELVPECVAISPLLVWLQVGVTSEMARAALGAAGIPLVQDRCLAVAHAQLAGR